MKYAQSAIATTSLYDTPAGQARDKLRGFYSDKRARTWTSNVRASNEHDAAPMKPATSFILTKSHAPMKRDVTRRRIK